LIFDVMATTTSLTSLRLERYGLFVGGQETEPESGRFFESINPTTGAPWAVVAEAEEPDVARAVDAAASAASGGAWRQLSPTRRGRLLMRLGDRIAEEATRIAAIETRDNGKLLKEMTVQAGLVTDWLYFYGGLADKIEGRVIPLERQSVLNYTLREPLGVVGIITPWNSPTFLTFIAAAPALAAGNTIVVKPSEYTSASIVEIARLATDVGFPPGVLNVVTGGREAGEALVSNPRVAKVAFTGGSNAGRAVAARVAERLGDYVLELGGKSPNIVFADADLDAAEAGVLAGVFGAAGQTCVAGSRALIDESVFDDFVDRLVRRAQGIRIGDPTRPETDMGPIANEPQLRRITMMVEQARAEGANVLFGGESAPPDEFPGGLFYAPTIVADVDPQTSVLRDEVFGPVLTVTPFRDEEEAVALANDSPYGLAAGVWTLNVRRAHRVARRLEAGTVWINMYRAMAFNSPFGGYKESGVGRQNGVEAINEYLQTKSVWCELGEEIQDPFTLRT
jgi:acyl-CoA reductase-like NAD-dependent aldehyde dehydrogenase